MTDFKKYDGLAKTYEYDKEKATLLAEAMTEKLALEKRIKYLTELYSDNKNLTGFLWTTLDGTVKALHDIEDDHLKNILTHIVKHGGTISPQIKAEATSRGFDIPETTTTEVAMRYLNRGRMIDAEIIDPYEDMSEE